MKPPYRPARPAATSSAKPEYCSRTPSPSARCARRVQVKPRIIGFLEKDKSGMDACASNAELDSYLIKFVVKENGPSPTYGCVTSDLYWALPASGHCWGVAIVATTTHLACPTLT